MRRSCTCNFNLLLLIKVYKLLDNIKITYFGWGCNNSCLKTSYLLSAEFEIGTPVPNTPCSYTVHASSKRQGMIMSPTYPGAYPKDLSCSYQFLGLQSQRIRLEFRDFDLFFGGPQWVGIRDMHHMFFEMLACLAKLLVQSSVVIGTNNIGCSMNTAIVNKTFILRLFIAQRVEN